MYKYLSVRDAAIAAGMTGAGLKFHDHEIEARGGLVRDSSGRRSYVAEVIQAFVAERANKQLDRQAAR